MGKAWQAHAEVLQQDQSGVRCQWPSRVNKSLGGQLDRTVVQFVSWFEEAAELDREFWRSALLNYRMQSLEVLRQ